ncbi:helix-turn-helix domain-containing protein [Streptococcus suis]|nr:helix-turn-helix domain-containing protein [Streptococcus suis]NQO44579.1 helix-turn-helix domain-containing protein [Streptococcus suis]NQO47100.1 helix-turn-helix domain-containing protein [Streptococcus suis]HEM3195778.1 helix-turn-helix domain-containing protein [Streptococcus suis 10581]HEM4928073.1 helix-turn-helix domain-containing protein [Streptococcus suis]
MVENSLYSNKIRYLRRKNNLSQRELCQELKISRQYLSMLERNLSVPSLIISIRIAKFFDKNIEDVFSITKI